MIKGEKMEEIRTDCERIIPEIEGIDTSDHIFVSERAIEAISQIKAENSIPDDMFIRIATKSGGCSGMNYIIGFDTLQNDNDITYKVRNHTFIVDRKSIFYLMGVTLDYIEDERGKGFVFDNPYHEKTCGCSH